MTTQTTRKKDSPSRGRPNKQAELQEWMTGLQMINTILQRQLELAVTTHEKEGEDLAHSLVGLTKSLPQPLSADCQRRINDALEALQTRDIVNQQMAGVLQNLSLLNELVNESRKDFTANKPPPDFEVLINRIYSSYVMGEQREIHHQVTGIKDSHDSSDKIQFF